MYNYEWKLSDAVFTKDKGKVLSCFSCGGGSTMGYKLAGFDVIGINDIDPKMSEVYIKNHKPKYSFTESITELLKKELPKELYSLDILDGSPPCSSFSLAGSREKDWGKEKKFREGQAEQVLDTLFFDFIELANKLKPKVVIAENVKGILMGNAIDYVKRIYEEFDKAGYYCQHFVLDSSVMGVPQKRERVFFICLRKDLAERFLIQEDMFTLKPKLDLNFNQKEIPFKLIQEDIDLDLRDNINESYLKHWENSNENGRSFETKNRTKFGFFYKAIKKKVLATITSSNTIAIVDGPKKLTKKELILCGSFPLDYDFLDVDPQYLIGMSVPPVMMANIASEVYKQWISKL